MGPLFPTLQDTARDEGLWETPLVGRVIAQPGRGLGTGRQAGKGSGKGLVLGTQGNPDRKPGAWQLPDHRYPSKFPMSPSECIPCTNPGQHGRTTGGRRMLSRVWGGSEWTRRGGLAAEVQSDLLSNP